MAEWLTQFEKLRVCVSVRTVTFPILILLLGFGLVGSVGLNASVTLMGTLKKPSATEKICRGNVSYNFQHWRYRGWPSLSGKATLISLGRILVRDDNTYKMRKQTKKLFSFSAAAVAPSQGCGVPERPCLLRYESTVLG